jgi:isopenicillin N synthase-like dioxygenase
MYFNEEGDMIKNPDPTAGLYVRNRQGAVVKVPTPGDHLAFQIGETAQIHSGGILQATPHAVKGAETPGCSR